MQGDAVLITGAARRIGAATARKLHEAGARIALHCNRSRAEADALAAELNGRRAGSCAVVQGDLLDLAALARIVEDAVRAFGRLDALVNNASSFYATPFGSITQREWDDLIGSNLRAPLFLAQAAAARLRESKGSIVNIVDIHAERPLANFLVYSVAKSGLAGLTRALDFWWAYGVAAGLPRVPLLLVALALFVAALFAGARAWAGARALEVRPVPPAPDAWMA